MTQRSAVLYLYRYRKNFSALHLPFISSHFPFFSLLSQPANANAKNFPKEPHVVAAPIDYFFSLRLSCTSAAAVYISLLRSLFQLKLQLLLLTFSERLIKKRRRKNLSSPSSTRSLSLSLLLLMQACSELHKF